MNVRNPRVVHSEKAIAQRMAIEKSQASGLSISVKPGDKITVCKNGTVIIKPNKDEKKRAKAKKSDNTPNLTRPL